MRKIEALLQEKLGERWLDDEAKKDHGFDALEFLLDLLAMPPDAVVISWPPTTCSSQRRRLMDEYPGLLTRMKADTPGQRCLAGSRGFA